MESLGENGEKNPEIKGINKNPENKDLISKTTKDSISETIEYNHSETIVLDKFNEILEKTKGFFISTLDKIKEYNDEEKFDDTNHLNNILYNFLIITKIYRGKTRGNKKDNMNMFDFIKNQIYNFNLNTFKEYEKLIIVTINNINLDRDISTKIALECNKEKLISAIKPKFGEFIRELKRMIK